VSDVEHVIEAIDGALADLSVSPDAMRWSPEPVPPEEPPGSPLAQTSPGRMGIPGDSWLAGIRIVYDPNLPPGVAVLVADRELAVDEVGLPTRLLPARQDTHVQVPARMDDAERERMLRLIAAAYDVPLCIAAGHQWGPEEVRVGVDAGPEGASVIHAYWAECTRCGERRCELRPGWVQELRR
jgi:hypothetical protein